MSPTLALKKTKTKKQTNKQTKTFHVTILFNLSPSNYFNVRKHLQWINSFDVDLRFQLGKLKLIGGAGEVFIASYCSTFAAGAKTGGFIRAVPCSSDQKKRNNKNNKTIPPQLIIPAKVTETLWSNPLFFYHHSLLCFNAVIMLLGSFNQLNRSHLHHANSGPPSFWNSKFNPHPQTWINSKTVQETDLCYVMYASVLQVAVLWPNLSSRRSYSMQVYSKCRRRTCLHCAVHQLELKQRKK